MGLSGKKRDGLKFACAGLLTAFFICCFSTSPISEAAAQEAKGERLTYFYKNPDLDGLPDTLRFFDASGWIEKGDFKTRPPVIGFLAALFEHYPDRVDKWIAGRYSPNIKEVIEYSLKLLGRSDKGRSDDSGLLSMRISHGADLDLLWGASFATGDKRYSEKIIDFVAQSLESGRFGAEDIAFLASRTTPRKKGDPKVVSIFNRYDEKEVPDLVLNSSAIWSLGSNAVQHDFVMAAVRERVATDPYSDLSYLLRKSVFRATSSGEFYFEGNGYKGVVSQTSAGEIVKTPNSIKEIGGWFDNVKAAFKREFTMGEPVYIATVLALLSGESVDLSVKILTPSGSVFEIGSYNWRAEDQNQLKGTAALIEPAHLEEEGVYTVKSVFSDEQNVELRGETHFFVGNR